MRMRDGVVALLAVVLLLPVIGCGGGDDGPSTPDPTYLRLTLSETVCADRMLSGPAIGTITSVSGSWESNEISLNPGSSVSVEVPGGGAYRLYFEATFNYWTDVYWDLTVTCPAERTTYQTLSCGADVAPVAETEHPPQRR